MKTLIIYAHPDHESHARFTLERVEQKLQSQKERYEILDLYKMRFNPVLSDDEIYRVKEKGMPDDVKHIQKKITESDRMIFIYPIWWNGMPAIMKGFVDRVFRSGFAYRYIKGIPIGLLKGKEAIAFVSTGSSGFLTRIFLGNRFSKNFRKDMMGFCGIKARTYQVGKAYALNDTQRSKIIRNVEKALG